jgi:DHA1 family inner membrane transport protein
MTATRTRPAAPLALFALAVSAFAIGTTEFVITGLLPEVADGFGVSIPTAGLLVSGYALGVVVGAPLVTAAVARLPRKPVLLGLLVLFVTGNLLSALAGDYAVMLAGRVVAALCHGAFFGVGSVVAAGLVAPDKKARAIAGMFTGLTLANVAGVPLGTLLGQHLGWRATFWVVAALGVLGMAGIAALVPAMPVPGDAGVRGELAAFRRAQVWLALAMTALGFGAVYAPFTYVEPLMTEVAGFAPSGISGLLVLFGCGLVVGNVIGARGADRRLMTTIITLLIALTGVLVVFFFAAHAKLPAAVTLFMLGVIGFATVPAFTSRVLTAAGRDSITAAGRDSITAAGRDSITAAGRGNTLASSAAVAAFNLGNATGAYLGGLVVPAGYRAPSLVGAAMAAGALVVAVISAGVAAVRPRECSAG